MGEPGGGDRSLRNPDLLRRDDTAQAPDVGAPLEFGLSAVGHQQQRHFIVPTINLDLLKQLEINLGVAIGITKASNGVFLKSIIGWTF